MTNTINRSQVGENNTNTSTNQTTILTPITDRCLNGLLFEKLWERINENGNDYNMQVEYLYQLMDSLFLNNLPINMPGYMAQFLIEQFFPGAFQYLKLYEEPIPFKLDEDSEPAMYGINENQDMPSAYHVMFSTKAVVAIFRHLVLTRALMSNQQSANGNGKS